MGIINIDILSQPTSYPKYYVTATLTKKNSDGTHTILLSDVEFPYGFTESISPHAYYDTIDNYFVFDQNGGYAFTFNWIWKSQASPEIYNNTLDFYNNIQILSNDGGRILSVEFVNSPTDNTKTGSYYYEWTTSSYQVETISIPDRGIGLKLRLTLIDNDYESSLNINRLESTINSTESSLYDWGVAFSTSSTDWSFAAAPSSVGYNTVKTSMKYCFDISDYDSYPSDWYLDNLSNCVLSNIPELIQDTSGNKQNIQITLLSGNKGYLADKNISTATAPNRVGYNGQTSTLLTFQYLKQISSYWYPSDTAVGYRDAMGGTSSEPIEVPSLNDLIKGSGNAFSIRLKINNNWVTSTRGYVKISGVWQPIKSMKTKTNNIWK